MILGGCKKVCEYAQICAISHTQHNGFRHFCLFLKMYILNHPYKMSAKWTLLSIKGNRRHRKAQSSG